MGKETINKMKAAGKGNCKENQSKENKCREMMVVKKMNARTEQVRKMNKEKQQAGEAHTPPKKTQKTSKQNSHSLHNLIDSDEPSRTPLPHRSVIPLSSDRI